MSIRTNLLFIIIVAAFGCFPDLSYSFSIRPTTGTVQQRQHLKHQQKGYENKILMSTTADEINQNNVQYTTKAQVFHEVCDTTGVTLKRFMCEVATINPELTELTTLFAAIETACKAISNLVRRSQLPSSNTLGLEGEINIQGEDQKKLDVITNDLLKRALRFTGRLGVLASEEEDDTDRYVAVFDPLDGSSNIDAGIPTGTIIGIYEHDESCDFEIGDDDDFMEERTDMEAQCLANTLQPGTNLVAAAYCLYSSSTFFVVTLGAGTYGFTLDENLGEFVLSHPKITIPTTSSILSFNEANTQYWDEPVQSVIQQWKNGTGRSGKQFSSRYIGSMVGDVHRTLLYGGVFGYPSDIKNPNGKLRLLYEGAPMSYIMEQAGGLSTTGTQRVMEISPTVVHQRVPVIMGSRNDVQEIIDAYTEYYNRE
jgi:fructose-1,6-bisphosphatase I